METLVVVEYEYEYEYSGGLAYSALPRSVQLPCTIPSHAMAVLFLVIS